jgi:tRNA threonylcarbamoyl adenosine modification protein YjeE
VIERFCPDEAATRALAAELAANLKAGDLVLLEGQLGAGKTTFVRGILEGLGYNGPVRSPTFNLLQTFETRLKVLHADLYRMTSAAGLGIEEYLATHLCLVEWPDRAPELKNLFPILVRIDFERQGRRICVDMPTV